MRIISFFLIRIDFYESLSYFLYVVFMERLQTLIKDKGISKYRLAKELHIAESTVRSWLKGISLPREKQMNNLASFFHVAPAWLRYGEPQHAPTLSSEAQMLAEEIAHYGPEGIHFAKESLKLLRTAKDEIASTGKLAKHKTGSG